MYFENKKLFNLGGVTSIVPKHLIDEFVIKTVEPLIKKAMKMVYLETGKQFVPQDYEKIYIRKKAPNKSQYRIDLFVHEIENLYQRHMIIDGIILNSKIHVNFVRNLESVDKTPRPCPSISYFSDNCQQRFWKEPPKLKKEKFGVSFEKNYYSKTNSKTAPKRDKWDTLRYEFA